jgi:hypothetical protein
VRHALLAPQAASTGASFLLDIVGVVISKEVNVSGNQKESQLSIVLRDVHCTDTIIAHFPTALCSGMMLGCVVSIKQCKFLLSKGGIRPYIVLHNSSAIGLLGHASNVDTIRFCAHSAHSQRGGSTTATAAAAAAGGVGDGDQGRISRTLKAASAGDLDDDGGEQPIPIKSEGSFRDEKKRVVAEFERDYVRRALERADDNVSEAARMAGLDRKSFWNLARRNGLHGQPRGRISAVDRLARGGPQLDVERS